VKAPEVYNNNQNNDFVAEAYSLGLIFYYICYRKPLYERGDKIKIQQSKYVNYMEVRITHFFFS
jgi:hypothetical protein